jgi:hypothetical protein
MRKWIIGAAVGIVALALGVTSAYGAKELLKTYHPQIRQAIHSLRGSGQSQEAQDSNWPDMPCEVEGPGAGRGNGNIFPREMGPGRGLQDGRRQGNRISIDKAAEAAAAYAAAAGSNFRLAEVMEFKNNFYGVIVEKDTGRGAVEVLIDPYSAEVTPEPGPNRMWNLKYGPPHHGMVSGASTDSTLSLAQARQAAQNYLDAQYPGATVGEGGFAFYGYYTFDYSMNGTTTGMLSVNGLNGQIWEHTWHGAFIAEKEITQ